MADAPVGPNSSSSKSLMWMMVGLFAGMGVLLFGGLFMAGRVVRSVGLSAAIASRDKIRTPGGDFRLQKEEQMGPALPVYPHVALELPDADKAGEALQQAQGGIDVVTYHSADPRVFIDEWYKEHLARGFTRYDAGDKPLPGIFRLHEVSDSEVAFLAERGNKVGIVALAMDEAGTKIALIRMARTGTAPAVGVARPVPGNTPASAPAAESVPASGSAQPPAQQ